MMKLPLHHGTDVSLPDTESAAFDIRYFLCIAKIERSHVFWYILVPMIVTTGAGTIQWSHDDDQQD